MFSWNNDILIMGEEMKSLFKAILIISILGSIVWFIYGEIMKDQACPNGHCSKNGRFQCE
jgi:hypothetical protein